MLRKSKKLLMILSFIVLIGIILLGVIYINKNMQKKEIYQLKNKTYYEVVINPNAYFLNDRLEADNFYIASSIKNINIYFDYYLRDETKESINYSYDIEATIKSYADNGTKLIWTKDFYLKNIDDKVEKEIDIKESYKLDYQYYVNYVKSFQEYYNIKTENYLYVKLNLKINDEDNPYVELVIPIGKDIIEITMKEDNEFLNNNKQKIDIKIGIALIIFVIASGYLIIELFLNKNSESVVLKAYQDIIIPVQNKLDINFDSIIYLTCLKDLIKIAENNNVNILSYQNNYYIIIDNLCYIYNFGELH